MTLNRKALATLRALVLKQRRKQGKQSSVFTPRMRAGRGWVRLTMLLSKNDAQALNLRRGQRGYKGVVTDLVTGKKYRVYGASCGLQCFCDAIVRGAK